MTNTPTPPPVVPNSDAPVPPVPLPPPPPDEETTQRVEVENEETRPFVKPDEAPPEVILRPLDGELDPADELGFDRPLFVPVPPPPGKPIPAPKTVTPTEEAIDGYKKLVASTRNERPSGRSRRKLKPTPPWPEELPPPEALFASVEERDDGETLDEAAEEAETLQRGANEVSGELDTSPKTELVIQRAQFPEEATQQPGVTPPSVVGLTAYRGKNRIRLVLATVVVLFSVAVGILTGVVLRLITEPFAPRPRAVAPSRPPAKTSRPPSRSRRRPDLDGTRKQAREATARDDHLAAYSAYGRILTHRPDDPAALLGYATSGVEVGYKHVLYLLQRSVHRELRREAPVLGVRLAMATGKWRRADRLVRALPRRARYSTRVMTWTAEIWHRLGRLESARPLLTRVLADPRLKDRRLRIEALVGLSEVQLKRNRRVRAYTRVREARELAAGLGARALTRRIERQIIRCRRALLRHPRSAPQGGEEPQSR